MRLSPHELPGDPSVESIGTGGNTTVSDINSEVKTMATIFVIVTFEQVGVHPSSGVVEAILNYTQR